MQYGGHDRLIAVVSVFFCVLAEINYKNCKRIISCIIFATLRHYFARLYVYPVLALKENYIKRARLAVS